MPAYNAPSEAAVGLAMHDGSIALFARGTCLGIFAPGPTPGTILLVPPLHFKNGWKDRATNIPEA